MNWILMPVLDCPEFTFPALDDCLAQEGVEAKVLVINQGSQTPVRDALEAYAAHHHPRVRVVTHDPPLPSLAASWNRGLETIWTMEGTEALVVNNDVRLAPRTYELLHNMYVLTHAYFVSGVGVREEQFRSYVEGPAAEVAESDLRDDRGGPDFSCFLISRDGHEKYPFDENFQPAYCEDLDLHRRMLLAGDGSRIFGVNLPFLHYGSRTINRSPETARAFAPKYEQSMAYYVQKWGGRCNQERYTRPFDPESQAEGMTTPDIQRAIQATE